MKTKARNLVRSGHSLTRYRIPCDSVGKACVLLGLLCLPLSSSAQGKDERLNIVDPIGVEESVDVDKVQKSAILSVQQAVKGRSAGMYVQEVTGEPGANQYMFLRGTSTPFLTKTSAMGTQPVVYVNGVPFITDRSFVYAIKNNDVNPIGPSNNILAGIDISNIQSIEIIKDPVELAKLGPLAANGAVWITTKNSYTGGRHATIDAQLGVVMPKGKVRMTNGWDELNFRKSFYPNLDWNSFKSKLPYYLQNTDDSYFFGPGNWADDYYSTALQYNVNASLGGGNKTANYLATVGATTNVAGADHTSYSKYNIGFHLNISPFTGAGFNAMIRYAYADRSRNKSIRDRYAEIEYMPEMETPLVPTTDAYQIYKSYSDNSIDDNTSKSLNGALGFQYRRYGIHANVAVKADYESAHRRAFWASTMMGGVNFVSIYSGYDRRFLGEASMGYDWNISDKHSLDVTLRGIIQEDYWHYNYSKGIDGDDDKKPTTSGGNYTQYRYLDEEKLHTLQTSLLLDYKFADYLTVNALFRADAASNVHGNNRWLFTPAFGATLRLNNLFFKDVEFLNSLNLKGSWSRIGKILESDRFAIGSIYTSESLGWTGSPIVGSMNGLATLTRPYSFGWVGFGSQWPYADKLEIGVNASFWNRRARANVSFYSNIDKRMMIPVPVNHEFGYQYTYKQGMDISNRGVEIDLGVTPIRNMNGWTWDIDLNMAFNKNKLEKLPDGLDQIEVNGRLLKVGESVDKFYVLENRGIYTDETQIPLAGRKKLSVNGKEFNVGDPIWTDRDGDNRITDADKVLVGNALPKIYGGVSTTLKYKRFDLSLEFFGAFGQKALNYRAYQTYNFANLDNMTTLDAIKEVNFWQTGIVPTDLPRYNVDSEINPYRLDQDMYLENASYFKLRNVTFGYTLPVKKVNMYLYVTGSNLLTFSGFSGEDPEAIDSDGVYRGYGLAMPKSVTVGFKCRF